MKDIQKILFPTDFSDTAQNAFRYALLLADNIQAAVQVTHVIYPEYEGMDIPIMAAQATQEKVEAMREVIQSFVDAGMTQVLEQLQHAPVIPANVEIGGPVSSISAVAERDEVDLIVVGTREKHNVLQKTFGSVTTGVIQNAPCHVLVVPENASFKPIKTIVYATDLLDDDARNIEEIAQLTQQFKPEFHVVHIETEKEEDLKMEELENHFASKMPTLDITFYKSTGDSVADSLNNFIKNHEVDLLVMYSPQRNIFERIFHQSQTNRMAYRTEIPLFVYKRRE